MSYSFLLKWKIKGAKNYKTVTDIQRVFKI